MTRRGHMLLATEVALALVTLAAIIGMHRLFVDGSYRGPLALQAIAAHLVVALLRRRRVPLLVAAGLTAVAAVLFITWTRFGDTVGYLLPTSGTLTAVGDDLDRAWQLFGDEKAPVTVLNGFIVATAAAIWILAFVADWAAFRARAAFEALLPATTLFLFAAALGAPGDRVPVAAVFAAAALLFVLLHRTYAQEESSTWAASHRARGRWSLLGTGAALTGIAVVAGAVTGPRLPGAEAEAVIDWRDIGDDEPTRVVPSPMISLRTRLVEQPNVEVFTVRSDVASYWRLTALDEFDGTLWKSSYGTDGADGELPRAVDSAVETETVRQQVTIEALNAVWLPAAFEPHSLDAPGTDVGWDEDSSTLIVDRDVPTSDGLAYNVTSNVPRWTAEELRTVGDELPEDIADQYLALPANMSPNITALAETFTAGATTPYDRAMALQAFLRNEPFVYDDTVGPGHNSDALVEFLFRTRRGYCEQFAGSFAALARAAGLPTRVAIGFTWGAQDPEEPTLYRVRGIHAHAWPEVYFHGFGWVPFEPTPGRAPVGANRWLGDDLPSGGQQDATGGAAAAAPANAGDGTDAGTQGDGLAAGDPGGVNSELLDTAGAPGEDGDTDGGLVPEEVRNAGKSIGLVVVAYLALVPLAIVGRRLIRRRRARAPADKVRLPWREATERAEAAGIGLPASLTIAETADRLAAALPASASAIQGLARTMERVSYAEERPTPGQVAEAHRAWASVKAELGRWEPWWQRLLRYFDIRQLRPRDRRARLITQHSAVVPAGR